MAKYICTRSCQVNRRFYRRGEVRDFASDPGSNFTLFTGDRLGAPRPPHLVDQDDGTYYFGSLGWDDLKFPFAGFNPPGLVSDPDIDTDDGFPIFDAGSTEMLVGGAQMPHAWKAGSPIRPHIHWSPTDGNSGNVLWRLEFQLATPGGTFPGSWTALDVVDAADETADKHQIASFGQIGMAGMGLSTIMKWRVSRVGGDASDTYGDDAKGLEFDIHYQIDSIGSGLEFEK